MKGTCPRCGGATGESRWCPACGKNLKGGLTLPTPEAAEAARRETAWLEEQREARARSGEAPAAGPVPPYGSVPASPYGTAPASPYGPGSAPPYMHPAAHEAPVNPSGLARVVRMLLYANILVASVVGILDAVYLREVNDLIAGGGLTETSDEAGVAAGVAYTGQLLLMCVTAGFFIAWLHRVYKNTRGLGATELRFEPGWAIGGWFVPVMSLWRPKEIVNDAWRASDPGLGVYADREEWRWKPVPGILLAWWLAYNLSSLAHSLTFGLWAGAVEHEEQRVAAVAAICSEMLLIGTALLALRVVTLITGRQSERAAEREHMPLPATPAPV